MISGLWFVILNVSEGSENINVGVNRSIRHFVPQNDTRKRGQ